MIEPTYTALIAIYYLFLFIGFLTVLLFVAFSIIWLLNRLAKKYTFLYMIVEYRYYRKEFKEFFASKKSVTLRFNKPKK